MRQTLQALFPGVLVAACLAAVATFLGRLAPVVGAPVIAIVLGIFITSRRGSRPALAPGLTFSAKTVLQASIVILGTDLSFRQLFATGTKSLPVLLGTLVAALVGATIFGRMLGIPKDLRTLIGVGTGVCGASAIAASDAVISASETDVSYAIATIFTFNVAAVLAFPTLGHLLSMDPRSFGLWAGTSINDMSSVVAGASIFSGAATSYAVIVKLTRTLMIIPITLALALWRSSDTPRQENKLATRYLDHVRNVFPIFVGWFLVAVAINTIGLMPPSVHGELSNVAQFLITMALGAIGLSTRIDKIRSAGLRPLALGGILWIVVAGSSLILQYATGTL